MTRALMLLLASASTLAPLSNLSAQIGGDGRDGVLEPQQDHVIDTSSRPGGRFYFSRIDIPKGVTLHLKGSNPAILHSQSHVTVAGTISADGESPSVFTAGKGGAGGFAGGLGGYYLNYLGQPGAGPGGGQEGGPLTWSGGSGGHAGVGRSGLSAGGRGGYSYGTAQPFDLTGGSGGGGGWSSSSGPRYYSSGAGGGGVVVVLADGPITVDGVIRANGGTAAVFETPYAGGAGAGGSVWLRSLRSVTIRGAVEALGGEIASQSGRFGGHGYIRLDAYGSSPVISGRVDPPPLSLELPHLRETIPARIGEKVGLGISSAPLDVVAVFLGLRSAAIPLPPFGVVRLDSTAGMWLLAAPRMSASDDAAASFVMPIPDNRLLDGLPLHWQALSIVTETKRPRLSNLVVTTIRP